MERRPFGIAGQTDAAASEGEIPMPPCTVNSVGTWVFRIERPERRCNAFLAKQPLIARGLSSAFGQDNHRKEVRVISRVAAADADD